MATKTQLYEYWTRSQIVTDSRILSAFQATPRENFIGNNSSSLAYGDHPLPIGHEQTISQPTTVMIMISLLQIEPHHRVLEIGAGSGYSAALMAKLADSVYTVETIPELAAIAEKNLQRLQLSNVTVVQGDGKRGYPDAQPYHRIIAAAAAPTVPPALLDQLADDGIIVIPVGHPYSCEMQKICKLPNGQFHTTKHGMFSFVPLV